VIKIEALPEKTRAVLQVIQTYVKERGFPPTMREIRDIMHMSSTSVVRYHILKLADAGLIVHSKIISRGIQLTLPE
jgi:repressor LexA